MANLFHAGGGYIAFGTRFDSRNRYIRQVANSADKTINMARGATIGVTIASSGSGPHYAWRWRCGDATQTGVNSAAPTAPDGFNTGLDVAL